MFDLICELTGVDAFLLRRAILIEIAIWAVMLIAVLVDMRAGIRRARTLGIKTDSHGLRRTFTKLGDYGKVTIMLLCVDVLSVLFGIYVLPWASGVSAVGAVVIECWSVRENLRAIKSPAGALPEFARKLAGTKDPQEVVRILRDFLALARETEHATKARSEAVEAVESGEGGSAPENTNERTCEP